MTWICPHPQRKRATQDTRAKTCNLVLGFLSPISPTTIIKLLLPGCRGLSYRQPESGGSPISFAHFSLSFSARVYPTPGVSASRASFAKAVLHWSDSDEALRWMPTTSLSQHSASLTYKQCNCNEYPLRLFNTTLTKQWKLVNLLEFSCLKITLNFIPHHTFGLKNWSWSAKKVIRWSQCFK